MRTPILAVGAYLALASPPLAAPALGSPWPDLSQPAPADARRDEGARDAALIVAIEDYAFVPDVPGARRNAADWRAWLRARGVPHVKVLQDAAAMHGFDGRGRPRGILTALEQTATKVGPGGTLWFVFIGHGAPNGDPAHPDGLLLAQSVQQTADGLQLAGIPVQAELLPRLRPAAKGARAVAVLDACFSGKVDADRPLVAGLQPVFVASVGAVPPGVTLLTAAKGDEYAGALPGLGRPAFSYLALGALQGWADQDGDGQVSGREVRQFAEDALFLVVTGRQQTPDAQGDLEGALAPARAARPDLAAIARTLAPPLATPLPARDGPPLRAPAVPLPDRDTPPPAAPPSSDAPKMGREEFLVWLRTSQAKSEAWKRAEALGLARYNDRVEAEWTEVLAAANDPATGLRAVYAFLRKYADNPLGNPREADAEALKDRLAAALTGAAPPQPERPRAAPEGGPDDTLASREDCQAMFDRVVEFELEGEAPMVAQVARYTLSKQAPQFVAECAGQASQAEVDCVLKAKDRAAYEACK